MSLKRIRLVALVAAILAGLSLLFLTSNMNKKAEADLAAQEEQATKFVIAAVDLAPYTRITEEMVALGSVNAKDTSAYFTSIEDVVGKVTRSDIYNNEALSRVRVLEEGDIRLGLANLLKNGMRGVTLSVDVEQGVAANIRVGNYVDIIYVGTASGDSGRDTAALYFESVAGEDNPANTQFFHRSFGENFSLMALQKVKVVSLDKTFYKDDHQESYASVTLEVSPDEATKIALLSKGQGSFRLTLRPQEDEGVILEPIDFIFKDVNEESSEAAGTDTTKEEETTEEESEDSEEQDD